MKKLLTILTAISLICTLPSASVYAQEDTDLREFAEAHNISGNTFRFSSETCRRVNSYAPVSEVLNFNYALAALTVLLHNGDISPDSLTTGAISVSDIELTDELDKEAYLYTRSLDDISRELAYGNYYCGHSQDELVGRLLEYGNLANESGRYFLARLRMGASRITDLVCIGLVEGDWSFEGNSYDKCIVTSDPSLKKEDAEEFPYDALGFTETCCIYINTKNNEVYIPEYSGKSKAETEVLLIADDADILSYDADLSKEGEISSKGVRRLSMQNMAQMEHTITVSGEKTVTASSDCYSLPEGLGKSVYQYGKSGDIYTSFKTYAVGDAVSFDIKAGELAKELYTPEEGWQRTVELNVDSAVSKQTVICNGEFFTELSDNKILIKKKVPDTAESGELISNKNKGFDLGLRFNDTDAKINDLSLTGISDGEVVFEIRPEGTVISCESAVDAVFTCVSGDTEKGCRFRTSEPIMFKKADASDNMSIYTDRDSDGIFEYKIEKGDADCNGIIDGRDASIILSDYAESSVGGTDTGRYLNENEDYNNDGIIDARDASAVLTYYAKQSVQ